MKERQGEKETVFRVDFSRLELSAFTQSYV